MTADHGQCPLPDSVGGVRLDPIQLEQLIESRFSGVTGVIESVVPSEVFMNVSRLGDNGGATIEDVAASLADYRYRQNIGPYVPRSAVEQDLLDQKEFAAVFGTTFLESLAQRDLKRTARRPIPRKPAVSRRTSPTWTRRSRRPPRRPLPASVDPLLQVWRLGADRRRLAVPGVNCRLARHREDALTDRAR